jgi:acetyl esterase/lipase
MRILQGGLLCLCLPLLLAAALADTVPDATLRLTPTGETAPLRLSPSSAAPTASPSPSQPLSFGPQKLAFPGNVSATFDLVYGSLRGFRPLTLDIYQPPARTTPLPLVVFVHGGGWNGGDTRHAASFPDFPRALAALSAQGYVVASVSYRLSGEARFPAAVQDIKAAIRWLRGHSRGRQSLHPHGVGFRFHRQQ